jgi:hypothetical protein
MKSSNVIYIKLIAMVTGCGASRITHQIKREFLLPPGEGHDCRDAGGRAMHGAIAEDEGI